MGNIFNEIEDNLFFDEEVIFDVDRIREYILDFIIKRVEGELPENRGFVFEQIVCDFFDYMGLNVVRSGKTRDFGIDGVIRLKIDLFGELNLGLQVKYKVIDSTDVDLFSASLRNAELRLGVIVCKESREMQNYELNSRLKAILFSRGIKVREKLIEENININPLFILKLDEIVGISARKFRNVVGAVYKK